jgi:hypothetical protein
MIRGSLSPILAELDAIGEAEQYLPPAAQEVKAHLQKTIAAGTSPSGQPWEPRKRDGGKPLQNAAAAVEVRVAGSTIIVELTGPEVFWHYGVRGVKPRKVIPTEIDESLGSAIRRGVAKPFRERAQ